jgi:hypothetical protein
MPIQREGKYLIIRELGITPSIGIETRKIRACIAAAKTKAFEGVFGTPSFGFEENNLDFLAQLPHLRQVWIWGCQFDSIEGVYSLAALEYCGLMENKRPGIDFSLFRRLETLITPWNPKDTGLRRSTIRRFHLWHFNPRTKTFAGLSLPPGCRILELYWLNPASLAGLEPLPKLRELGIHCSRNMQDLALLPHFAPNLRQLIVTGCKRLKSPAGIADHPMLKVAKINGTRMK